MCCARNAEGEIPLTFSAIKTQHRSMGRHDPGVYDDIATAARFAQPNLTRLLMLAHELYLRVQEDTTLKLTYDSRKTDRP